MICNKRNYVCKSKKAVLICAVQSNARSREYCVKI